MRLLHDTPCIAFSSLISTNTAIAECERNTMDPVGVLFC